jgi:hypothetical protein
MTPRHRPLPPEVAASVDAARTRLSGRSRVPALAALVADLVAKGFKPTAVSRHLLLTDSYVAKLLRIMRDVPSEILRQWRVARRPLSVDAMLSVRQSADPAARYRALQPSPYDRPGKRAALERAREYGRLFARLDAMGFRAPLPPYDDCIGHMFPQLDPRYWDEVVASVEQGWADGVAECDDTCDEAGSDDSCDG